MRRILAISAALALMTVAAVAQTSPGFTGILSGNNNPLSSAGLNSAFAGKQDYNAPGRFTSLTTTGNAAVGGTLTAPVLATGSTTPRSLADRASEVFNVRDWGAVGNGVVNDTAAIQAAINAAQVAGGRVYFPPGEYSVSALSVTASNVYFEGAGQSVSWIRQNTANTNVLTLGVAGTWLHRMGVSKLGFWPKVSSTSGSQVLIQDVNSVWIDNFIATGGTQPAIYWDAIRIESPGGWQGAAYIDHFWIEGMASWAFNLGQSSDYDTHVAVQDVFISTGNVSGQKVGSLWNGNGIGAFCVSGLLIQSVDMTGYLVQGFVANPTTSHQTVNGVNLRGLYSDTIQMSAYIFEGAGLISEVQITGSWGSGSGSGSGLVINSGPTVDGLSIENSYFHGNAQNGILINSATARNLVMTGNQIYQNSAASPGTYNGISLLGGASAFTISNNSIGQGGFFSSAGPRQGWGILVGAGAGDGYVIVGNRGAGNISGMLSDLGTGTTKYVAGNIAK